MGNIVCNCFEHQRKNLQHQQRIEKLQEGAAFNKRKYTFGIGTGHESIWLKMAPEGDRLCWKSQTSSDKSGEIELGQVKSFTPNGDKTMVIVSTQGDVLLEVEAENSELRNAWATDLQLVLEHLYGRSTVENPKESATTRMKQAIKEKVDKKKYWESRQADLEARKLEAEERKKKFSGAGMKYTALAMANRS